MDRDKVIGRWVSIIYRNAMVVLTRRLAPLGVGRGQYLHLTELYQHPEGLGQDVLSERLLIDKGTTARALAQLETKGLVRRERNPDDRRGKIVHLTDRGHALRDDFFRVLWSISDDLVSGLSTAEQEQALDLLKRMAANVEAARECRHCTATDNES